MCLAQANKDYATAFAGHKADQEKAVADSTFAKAVAVAGAEQTYADALAAAGATQTEEDAGDYATFRYGVRL